MDEQQHSEPMSDMDVAILEKYLAFSKHVVEEMIAMYARDRPDQAAAIEEGLKKGIFKLSLVTEFNPPQTSVMVIYSYDDIEKMATWTLTKTSETWPAARVQTSHLN